MKSKKIVVVGLGHIGLPTAMLFADSGNIVEGFDTDQRKIDAINSGDPLFDEPGLTELLQKSLKNGTFSGVKELIDGEVFIIAVPTPLSDEYHPDLSHVSDAIETIAPILRAGDLVVIESTSPVGTTDKMYSLLKDKRPDLYVDSSGVKESDPVINIAYCSERAIPGNSIKEMVENRRVIGGLTNECSLKAKDVYSSFVTGELIVTDAKSAEMSKLVENTFRDVNIAFANELSLLCDSLDMDVTHVTALANGHPRVSILKPGIGVGGHCLPVDPWFLISSNWEHTQIMKLARETNDSKSISVAHKIEMQIESYIRDQRDDIKIAFLGLSYKPDSSDIRNSPAINICKYIVEKYNCTYNFVDPNLQSLPQELIGENRDLVSLGVAVKSDLIFLLVEHIGFSEEILGKISDKVIRM